VSNWERLLERETVRALRRIQIAAPDLAAARAREAQAHEEYSDSVIDGYNSHAGRECCPENHGFCTHTAPPCRAQRVAEVYQGGGIT
jgi:hypothetical protein